MRELLRRLHHLLHRSEFERELEDEMRHHMALSAAQRGSAAAANRQFGNMTLLREESRAMWTWTVWEQFLQDLRYGLRTMAANPLFTAIATISLALGIGANTAIFSFMDAILLRTLPVRSPQELVVFHWKAKGNPGVIHGLNGSMFNDKATGRTSPNFPFAAFQTIRANPDMLSTVFAYAGAWRINIVARQHAEVFDGQYVSGGFYTGLGVTPAAGRLIADEDDRAGAPPVAVLSYAYWQRRFDANPAAVGQSILINNTPFNIIGVSSPEFFGVNPGAQPEVYLPLHAAPLLSQKPKETEQPDFFDANFYWVEMMGRLRPGVSRQRAQSALAVRFQQFAASTATTEKERVEFPALWLEDGAGGLDSLRRQYSKPLFVLMAMVGLILTIACANIASLLLARATARRREIAIRLSIGAGRMRVIRQLLTESVLLSLAGGVLGLFVAMWGIRSLTWLLANGRERFTLHASLNWQVMLFTLGLAVATGALFGLAPALQSTRLDLTGALKESRASEARGRSQRFGLGHALVAVQIALSLLLVVGAGLFVRTLANLHSVNLGFNEEKVLLFNLDARRAGYKDAALAQFYGDLLNRFRQIPGVKSAGLSEFSLVSGYWNSLLIRIPGAPPQAGEPLQTCVTAVDPGFLPTMQIPILLGRGLEERDLASPRVAVVTEAFVKKFFPNENPVGRRIALGKADNPADIEIVGVARASLYNSVKEKETPPLAYVPYTQDLESLNRVFFELRAVEDPLSLVPAVRKIVHEASPNVPVVDVKTQTAQIDQIIGQEKTFAQLCSGFAALALVIACVGLYGTMAYTVERRTSEIGIRMALGAMRAQIVWMVLRESLAVAAAGAVVGLGAAWGATRFVESYLFGMKPHDPGVLAGAVLALVVAAVAAGCAPAWRAARIDPLAALRHE
jgi:macrolide transport system ATP-binding/permease protein